MSDQDRCVIDVYDPDLPCSDIVPVPSPTPARPGACADGVCADWGIIETPETGTIAPVPAPPVQELADTGLGADAGLLGLALLVGGLVAYLGERWRTR